jgi:hypothetical protein
MALHFASLILLAALLFGLLDIQISDVKSDQRLIFGRNGLLFVTSLFIFTLLALINLENTYRSLNYGRKRVKYTIIILMGSLTFHLLIYSLILGFSYMRLEVFIISSFTLVIANICAAYTILKPVSTSSRIYVSRQIVAKSYTLLLAGVYLLIVGAMGKIVQIIGKNLNLLLMFSISLFLVFSFILFILSKSLKNRFQYFIERNFYRSRYDYRTEWEKFSKRVFSNGPVVSIDKLLDKILFTVSETIGVDHVCMMMLNENSDKFELFKTNNAQSISSQNKFFDWLWRYAKPIRIVEGKCVARDIFSQIANIPELLLSALKTSSLDSTSGVIVPIIAEHKLLGIIILGDRKTQKYSQEDMDLLETMANQISIAIMNVRRSEKLAESRELESFHKLSAMLLHDLKSSASMLSLVIQNASENFGNPEFQKDALSTMSNVANRIQRMIQQLSTAPQKKEFRPSLQPVDLNDVIENALVKSGVKDIKRIKVIKEFNTLPQMMMDPDSIERIILNLVLNSVEAIDGNGDIIIKTCRNSKRFFHISVSDTGCGMSEEFIKYKLFHPFQTTKSKGIGLGLYQCKSIIDAYGGSIEVQSNYGAGSVFTVKLPIWEVSKDQAIKKPAGTSPSTGERKEVSTHPSTMTGR